MNKNRNAFTMIELVFVIVVLGILAAVAVPKLAATRADAHLAKGKSDVSAIRSGIVTERQARLFRGQSSYINRLDAGVSSNANGVVIFDHNGTATNSILQYGITTSNSAGGWQKTGSNQYTFFMGGSFGNAVFTYDPNTGTFNCASSRVCSILTD